MVLLIGRSGLAIAAGYAFSFSMVVFIAAPVAVIVSLVTIRYSLKRSFDGMTAFGSVMGPCSDYCSFGCQPC